MASIVDDCFTRVNETSLKGRLLFAIPKKGRLHEHTLELLKGADISYHRHHRLDIALVKNLPAALVFLPAADIPTFVAEGQVALGITGRDQLREYEASNGLSASSAGGAKELLDLGFGACRLQVQVPQRGTLTAAHQLLGKTVVTSFTGLARRYFDELEAQTQYRGPKTVVRYVGGSVEAACALGVAAGIVDLVESGETMRVAGLKAIDTVVESSAILLQSHHAVDESLVRQIRARIQGYLDSQRYLLCKYNIQRQLLAAAHSITPGKTAPTIMSLSPPEGRWERSGSEWVAVEAMVAKAGSTQVMEQLWELGARDILMLPLSNTRTQD